jgi:hypothetical protein
MERGVQIASSLYFLEQYNTHTHTHKYISTIKNGKLGLGSSKYLHIFIFSITDMIQMELVDAYRKYQYFTL